MTDTKSILSRPGEHQDFSKEILGYTSDGIHSNARNVEDPAKGLWFLESASDHNDSKFMFTRR